MLAEALHVLAAVLNPDHADMRAVFHALEALRSAAANAAHAAFIPDLTREGVPLAYAALSADVRARYAAETAWACAPIAVPMADSRAFTAAPTHAMAAPETADVELASRKLPDVISASAGAAAAITSAMLENAKSFLTIFIFEISDLWDAFPM